MSVHLSCLLSPSVKTNGKRGSAVVLLSMGSAYTGFFDFSRDASIASLTDAAPDLAAYVLLPTGAGTLRVTDLTDYHRET